MSVADVWFARLGVTPQRLTPAEVVAACERVRAGDERALRVLAAGLLLIPTKQLFRRLPASVLRRDESEIYSGLLEGLWRGALRCPLRHGDVAAHYLVQAAYRMALTRWWLSPQGRDVAASAPTIELDDQDTASWCEVVTPHEAESIDARLDLARGLAGEPPDVVAAVLRVAPGGESLRDVAAEFNVPWYTLRDRRVAAMRRIRRRLGGDARSHA